LVELGGQCVYLNPHAGLEYPLPYVFDPHTKVARLETGIHELHVHLPKEHSCEDRLLTSREVARLTSEIERVISGCRIKQGVLLLSQPVWFEVAAKLRRIYGFEIIYDCHDWLPGFTRISRQIIASERALLEGADAVVFSSPRLQDLVVEHMPRVLTRCSIIRNGVDPRDFSQGVKVRTKSHPPTVGYAGALDYWFDVEALLRSALDHPDWRFVVLGRVEHHNIRRLESCPNVEMKGEVPYSDIPPCLAAWDAAVIPFLRNDLTLAANPIKLYEYFSAGLPVVSTRLPEVELYEKLVYFADTPAQFSSRLSEALQEKSPELKKERIATASRETWLTRANAFMETISTVRCARNRELLDEPLNCSTVPLLNKQAVRT